MHIFYTDTSFLYSFSHNVFKKNLNRKLSARCGYTPMEGSPPAQFFLFGFSLGSNQHSSITCLVVIYPLYCLRSSFSSLSQNKQSRLGEQKWSDTAFSAAKRIDVYQLLLLFIVYTLTIGYSSICGLILCLAANCSILLLTWRLATREPANLSWCPRKGPPWKVSGFSVTPTRMNVPLGFNREKYWSQGKSPLTVLMIKSSLSSFSIFSSVNSLLFQNSWAPKDLASSVLLYQGRT